jgi:hypothetical protein
MLRPISDRRCVPWTEIQASPIQRMEFPTSKLCFAITHANDHRALYECLHPACNFG